MSHVAAHIADLRLAIARFVAVSHSAAIPASGINTIIGYNVGYNYRYTKKRLKS